MCPNNLGAEKIELTPSPSGLTPHVCTPDALFSTSIPIEDKLTSHEVILDSLSYGIASSWWNSAQTLVSIYVENDAGLMLVGASQLLLSSRKGTLRSRLARIDLEEVLSLGYGRLR